jgi:diaminopimelate epimerase
VTAFPFWKMEGCGNDFVVVYRSDLPAGASPSLAPALCDRHFGVGADGVLVVDAPGGAPGAMTVWNRDGSIAEMCGNGLRCVATRLLEDGRWSGDEPIALRTGAGLLRAARTARGIRLSMGAPTPLGPVEVSAAGASIPGERVSMGNPHFVVQAPRELPDLQIWGPIVEVAPAFPRRTNVEWVQQRGPAHLEVRVWERGVGETLACGSGACASVVAAMLGGRVDFGRDVQVDLPGGTVWVDWSGAEGDEVWLEGPARTVFRADWRAA